MDNKKPDAAFAKFMSGLVGGVKPEQAKPASTAAERVDYSKALKSAVERGMAESVSMVLYNPGKVEEDYAMQSMALGFISAMSKLSTANSMREADPLLTVDQLVQEVANTTAEERTPNSITALNAVLDACVSEIAYLSLNPIGKKMIQQVGSAAALLSDKVTCFSFISFMKATLIGVRQGIPHQLISPKSTQLTINFLRETAKVEEKIFLNVNPSQSTAIIREVTKLREMMVTTISSYEDDVDVLNSNKDEAVKKVGERIDAENGGNAVVPIPEDARKVFEEIISDVERYTKDPFDRKMLLQEEEPSATSMMMKLSYINKYIARNIEHLPTEMVVSIKQKAQILRP